MVASARAAHITRRGADFGLQVGGEILNARQIFINVGARATVPPVRGLRNVPYFTTSSILEIEFPPRNLMMVGGSYVELEFGRMFSRFGGEATILERGPRLRGHEDEDVSSGIRDLLIGEGIKLQLNAEYIELPEAGGEIEGRTNYASGSRIRGMHVLIATGLTPNDDDLGLENPRSRAISADSSKLTTSCERVFRAFGVLASAVAGRFYGHV